MEILIKIISFSLIIALIVSPITILIGLKRLKIKKYIFLTYLTLGIVITDWKDIEKMIAYKVDLIGFDEVCIDIHTRDKNILTLTEEFDGYEEFVRRTKDIFESIPKDWELRIIKPPFERNEITLIDKL